MKAYLIILCSLILNIGGSRLIAENAGSESTKIPLDARVEPQHKIPDLPPIGNIIVKYSDGSEDTWTLKGNCSRPKVSQDGLVGWVVYSLQADGKSLEMYNGQPVSGRITICNKGRILITVPTRKAFIERWGFSADGAGFIVKSRGSHGPATIEKFQFKSTRPVEEINAYSDNLPDWALPYKD